MACMDNSNKTRQVNFIMDACRFVLGVNCRDEGRATQQLTCGKYIRANRNYILGVHLVMRRR